MAGIAFLLGRHVLEKGTYAVAFTAILLILYLNIPKSVLFGTPDQDTTFLRSLSVFLPDVDKAGWIFSWVFLPIVVIGIMLPFYFAGARCRYTAFFRHIFRRVPEDTAD